MFELLGVGEGVVRCWVRLLSGFLICLWCWVWSEGGVYLIVDGRIVEV